MTGSRAGARGRSKAVIALALAGALGALVVVTGAVEVPGAASALSGASDSLGGWAYVVVPGLAFLETGAFVGLLVPGETAVLVGGVVAERGGVSLVPLIAFVWIAAVAGDVVSFLLGRWLGPQFLVTHGPKLRIRPAQVVRVQEFFARHGGAAVVTGRFVGVLRALTPFVAGASGFPLRKFVPYSAAGALGWATTFTLVGYAFSGSFATAGTTVTRILLAAALLAAVMAAVLARAGRRHASLP